MKTAGIILCGGKSSRMGRPKPWLTLAGETLLARAVRVAKPCVSQTLVCAAPRQRLPPVSFAFKRVNDIYQHGGPLAALQAALALVDERNFESAVVLAVDMALVNTVILQHMIQLLRPQDEAVIPLSDGHLQPLCAVYRPRARRIIAELTGTNRSMHAWVDRLAVRTWSEEEIRPLAGGQPIFASLNTPEEYERIRGLVEYT